MTRSFLMRAAMAAVPLTVGLVFTLGKNSMYDRMISALTIFEVGVVMVALVALFVGIALWVIVALEPSKWAKREASHGKAAAVIAVISAACLASPPARAVVLELPLPAKAAQPAPVNAVEIEQPFALTADIQRQVDAAIEILIKQAKDNPGDVVSVQLAVGIFIAIIVVGLVATIIVRMVCSSLDRMKQSLNSRLSRLKDFLRDPGSNQPVVVGAALFNHRPASTNDLSIGTELRVGFTAPQPEEQAALVGAVNHRETVTLSEFIADFGLTNNLPSDSVVGQSVSRAEGGYLVAPPGFTNFVTLAIESTVDLTRNAWRRAVTLRVPAGAILDVADLTGNSDGRYWRVGVAQ